VATYLIVLALAFQNQGPTYFTLVSTDCTVTGPVKGEKIESWPGTPWVATCTVKDGRLLVAAMETESKKPLGNESCEYVVLGDIGMAISDGGAIRYIFDFAERRFYHGQVNILVEKAVVVTKTCLGRIEFK